MRVDSTWQVCAYLNDLAGNFHVGLITDVELGDTVRVAYRYQEGEAYYSMDYKGRSEWTMPLAWAKRQIAVGPWHGGTSPAPVATSIMTQQNYVR